MIALGEQLLGHDLLMLAMKQSGSYSMVWYGVVLSMVLSCFVDGCAYAQEEDGDELGNKSSSHCLVNFTYLLIYTPL